MAAVHYFVFPTRQSDNCTLFIKSSIENSFTVDHLEVTGDSLSVKFKESITTVDFEILVKKLLFIGKTINKDLIFSHLNSDHQIVDVYQELVEKKDVQKIAPGMFMFQGEFLQVFNSINQKVKQLSQSFMAQEQEYPALWPVELLKKINYFEEFPQQIIMCGSVTPTKQSRERIARKYSNSKAYETVDLAQDFDPAIFGLQAAVCDCCYYAMQDKENVKDASYTCYNKVFRNESSQTGGLDRLTNFSVRDIMFVGSDTYVLDMRQQVFNMLEGFVRQLNLSCILETANDPFFASDVISKSVFQYAKKLKHELLFDLPEAEKKMAFGSVNLHLDFFGKSFNITQPDGTYSHSACVGIGLERITYALFCQHGSQFDAWPIETKRYLGLI